MNLANVASVARVKPSDGAEALKMLFNSRAG